jgi:hypothetical protein
VLRGVVALSVAAVLFLLALAPAGASFSIDAIRNRTPGRTIVSPWALRGATAPPSRTRCDPVDHARGPAALAHRLARGGDEQVAVGQALHVLRETDDGAVS